MTVTVVFGKTSDGGLTSEDSSYSSARSGPANATTSGSLSTSYIGQNDHSPGYMVFQTFIGFDYPAIPDTERVTAAMIRLKPDTVHSPSISVEAYALGYLWSSGGLTASDWRTPAQLAGYRLDMQYGLINKAAGKFTYGGSDEFLAAMIPVTSMEEVVVTSRAYHANTPSSDEGIDLWMSDVSGTASDPALIFTSAPRSTLYGVMGAQVQLSDGTWCFLESNAAVAPVITLKHEIAAGTQTTIGTLPIGTTSSTFRTPGGAQAFALVVDASDNLYVISRAGNAENNIAARCYLKGAGYTWTAGTLRSAAMPSISTAINQVVAAYHEHSTGVITCFVGHTAGPGHPTTTTGVMQATLNANYLRTGSGSLILGSGSSSNIVMPFVSRVGTHNTYPNEVGNGMDVAVPLGGNPSWGFFYSFQHGQLPGDNGVLASARYILSSSGSAFSHYSTTKDLGWGRKDAAGKVRVVPISSTTACFVSTDSDSTWSLTVFVQQHTGTEPGSVTLGGKEIGQESITSFPDGPVIAQSSAWDAVYNSTENKLWIYYVDALDDTRVMRTSFDLTTMQYDRNEVEVYNALSGTTIHAVRVERNRPITRTGLVSIARVNAGTYALVTITDTFNVAPTAPTLTPEPNFDASTAQTFEWTFNDPNLPSDTQSAYQLEISRVDNGVVALDTGKVTSATPSRSVAGGTLTNGVAYQWRVRTYDSSDVESPWSEYGTFTTSAGGTVTITDPATDNVVGIVTDDYPVAWSVTGTTQAGYRVWLYRGATLVSDTGWITSTATTHTIAGMTSDVEHTVQVRVRNASNVESDTGSRLITPSFAVPETPLLDVSVNEDEGYVLLTVENPAPGAPVLGYTEEDFETGVGTFTAPVGATFVQSSEQAHRGTYSGKLEVVGSPTQAYVRPAQVACVPGQRLTVRMWAYLPAGGNMQCSIDWFTAGGSYLSTTSAQSTLAAGVWTSVQASGTAPATAELCSFGPTLAISPPTGTVLYVDEVVLTGASDRPDVSRNEILRRVAGTGSEWEILGETEPDGTFRDYRASSGVAYQYRVRGQA